MTRSLKVVNDQWTILCQKHPRLKIYCKSCKQFQPFVPSNFIRLNGHGKKLDAWLIYHCEKCDQTWNRPILERASVHNLDAEFLRDLETNDRELVQKLAWQTHPWPQWPGTQTEIRIQSKYQQCPDQSLWMITIRIKGPVKKLRLEKLIAQHLGISRNRIQKGLQSNLIQANGKFVRDGQTITIQPGLVYSPICYIPSVSTK